ncbi:transmembrane protein 79 isoform X2 [Oryzias melastigma]|uniref:transmembrane protein 79 isoform X2 n=1 Tax=Oryzias melastigma TaxID=30732 RepID=UPI000CF81E22|nr:transmembrane protein 79 isoform X2 [Oryzias melastigma]
MDPQEKPQVLDPNMSEPSRESRDSGSPAAQIPERGKLKDRNQEEDLKDPPSEEEDLRDPPSEEEEDQDMEEEEKSPSALLEPSTLLWSGNLNRKILLEQNPDSEEGGEGSQVTDPSRWRESMPEGERWRDEVLKEDCWLADDEEEEDEDTEVKSGKPAAGFTPHITVLTQDPNPDEIQGFPEKEAGPPAEPGREEPLYREEWEEDNKVYLCEHVDRERLGFVASTLVGGLLFPLLVWGGYALLPFDPPVLRSAPLRVIYTLRCAFFAMIPIVLGVLVKGVARLRHCALKPLYLDGQVDREVRVHGHFVSESLALFLFYFLQLGVLATYVSQDLVKLVPLLTIVFVFGRLIYWLCLALGSSVRGMGFAFSFLPMLVMLGANLYYMCSSVGPDAIFDVAVPTPEPPPRMRWWF